MGIGLAVGLDEAIAAEVFIVWDVAEIATIRKEAFKIAWVGQRFVGVDFGKVHIKYEAVSAASFGVGDFCWGKGSLVDSSTANGQAGDASGDLGVSTDVDWICAGINSAAGEVQLDNLFSVDIHPHILAVINAGETVPAGHQLGFAVGVSSSAEPATLV